MKATKELVQAGRIANIQARQASTPLATPDGRKGKRSTAAPRLASRTQPFTGVRFTVDYQYLVPDNQKYMATGRGGKARLFLTPHYRESKNVIAQIARRAMKDMAPYGGDVQITATIYVPDERRRDVTNLAKGAHDAMSGVVYEDDDQIKRALWVNAGLDRERPRCEIAVEPLKQENAA